MKQVYKSIAEYQRILGESLGSRIIGGRVTPIDFGFYRFVKDPLKNAIQIYIKVALRNMFRK